MFSHVRYRTQVAINKRIFDVYYERKEQIGKILLAVSSMYYQLLRTFLINKFIPLHHKAYDAKRNDTRRNDAQQDD